MPAEVRNRVHLRLDRIHTILGKSIEHFNNVLTIDSTTDPANPTQQEWNFVEFPITHQSYFILQDGTLCHFLRHQEKHHRTTAMQSITALSSHSPQAWFEFCISLEYAAANNRMWIHPYFCHQRTCSSDNGYGFLVADPIDDCDSDIHIKYDYLIEDWSN